MKLEIKNKHAVYRSDDGYVLLDTGSPVTIERQSQSLSGLLGGLMAGLGLDGGLQERVLGKLESEQGQSIAAGLGLSDDRSPVDLEKVSRKVGVEITKLLGTDNMNPGPVLIDYRNNRLEFDGVEEGQGDYELPCQVLMGIPVVTIKIAGVDRKMFLDTGAPTSYIASCITEGMMPTGNVTDFHPLVGEFKVPTFELETEIADFRGGVTYGNLPDALAQYEQVGCDGIIGYDLFSRFGVVLNLRDERVSLRKAQESFQCNNC